MSATSRCGRLMAADPGLLVTPGRPGGSRWHGARVCYVEIEARAPQTRVPEQQLDAAQVDAGFEQMGREAMPKEMRINNLGELGGVAGLCADMGDAHTGDRLSHAVSGKEPGVELIQLPVAPQ